MDEEEVEAEWTRLGARRTWAMSVGRTFASNLRRARGGRSQQHVALVMAALYGHSTWHQTTVAKVESGERDVKLIEAVALAEILGKPLSELIGSPDGEHSEEA